MRPPANVEVLELSFSRATPGLFGWISGLLLLTITSCESGSGRDVIGPLGDVDAVPFATEDLTENPEEISPFAAIGDLFERTRVLEIEVFIDPNDWDFIRFQTRDIMDILGGEDCMSEPFGSPFTYVMATIRIDGVLVEDVGIRKKGFLGSLDDEKPALKIKFDEYVDGVEIQGYERLTLNNCRQDPALVRQCLGYDFFAAAGVPAPRCNFAHVVVNGADLGIYANVESVKKRFLKGHFADAGGDLYEGTLSDFREGWSKTFEKKTNKLEPDSGRIEMLRVALEATDDDLPQALEPLLDVDTYLTFWAAEVLLGHWDGYAGNTNNFFVYDDPSTGKFLFLPWGTDGILGSSGGEEKDPGEVVPLFPAVLARGHLARRLYLLPAGRDLYVARLQEMLQTVWSEAELHASMDAMEELLSPYVEPWVLEQFDVIRVFVNARRLSIAEQLTNGAPPLTEPPADKLCFLLDEIGSLDVHFETTFGTLGEENIFQIGEGTFAGQVNGEVFDPLYLGFLAGFSEEGPEQSVVLVPAYLPDKTVLLAFAAVPTALFKSGSTVELGLWQKGAVYLIRFDPETDTDEMLGMIGEGTITFEEASPTEGEAVVGSFSGTLIKGFF